MGLLGWLPINGKSYAFKVRNEDGATHVKSKADLLTLHLALVFAIVILLHV